MWPLVVYLLATPLAFAQPADQPADQARTEASQRADASAEGAKDEPSAKSEVQSEQAQGAFDPALVGLPDFPTRFETPADFGRAEALIDARLDELAAANLERTAATADDESEATSAEDGSEEARDPTTAPEDTRSAQLEALRIALQRTAAISSRIREVETALLEQQESLAALERDGLDTEPPYSVTLFDQLLTERALAAHTEEMAERLRGQARQRAESASASLAIAVRERRAARDREQQAADGPEREAFELRLEHARLAELLSRQRLDAALLQQALAAQEDRLAEAQQALLDAKLQRVRPNVVFTTDALDERLAEVTDRQQALLGQAETLTAAGDAAESALFQARARLQNAEPNTDTALLQEQMHARDDQLSAARKGAEYLRQAADLADTARTLLERRFALLQGSDKDQWPQWLRDTDAVVRAIDQDKAFIYAELTALRSIHLALSRRLAVPDLDANLRQALSERMTALDRQEESAEAFLVVLDQVRSLGQRLRDGLAPVVSERSLEQRLEQAQAQIASWWNHELLAVQDQGIYVRDVVTGLGVFLLVLTVVSLLKSILRRKVLPRLAVAGRGQERKTSSAVVSALIRNTNHLFVLIVAFYLAMTVSGLGQGKLQHWLGIVLIVALYLQMGLWANAGVVDFFQRKRSRKEREDPSAVTGYGLLLFFLRAGIWIVVLVSLMAYFQYPVAGLIGALGVGGIAVAFAVQNILGDVFSSLAIILDKPFRVGDFIVAGETIGVIEHIGVKTTRIRSLSGELVVMSNTDLLGSCIHNYKHMRERRVVFKLGVTYQTPPQKLERIPRMIEEIIGQQASARFDRAHFAEYGDFSLNFEIVYYVIGADFTLYMDTQQAINLAIYRGFQELDVEFAYPTQQLFISQAAGT